MEDQRNITVAVRIRPLQQNEIIHNSTKKRESLANPRINKPSDDFEQGHILKVLDTNLLLFDPKKKSSDKRQFRFDSLLDSSSSQITVFEATAAPLIKDVLDGINCTLFAYGATGCGKTHTITGSEDNPGLIYLSIKSLFAQMDSMKESDDIQISLSFLEVYNETVRDLFQPGKGLELREDNMQVQVAGLSEKYPQSLDHVMKLLLKGNSNRAKAPTAANLTSSRSHAVLQIHLKRQPKLKTATNFCIKTATLSIIDLAGSERASATLNKGDRLNEGANINRSLLALGNCINALCSSGKASSHIPFRDSKLTRILKFSLTGNCRVVMVACVSPSFHHIEETLNTLKYANRAKEIKTKVTQNTMDVSAHVSQYPKIIADLRQEIERLKGDATKLILEDSIIEKMRQYFDKLESKEKMSAETDFERRLNELKIDRLQSYLVLLNNLEASVDERKSWNDIILLINLKIDDLLLENSMKTHNLAEYERAMNRYRKRIQSVVLDAPAANQQSLIWQMDLLVKSQERSRHYDSLLVDLMKNGVSKLASLAITFAMSSQKLSVPELFGKLVESAVGAPPKDSDEFSENSKDSLVFDVSSADESSLTFDESSIYYGGAEEEEQENLNGHSVTGLPNADFYNESVVAPHSTPKKRLPLLAETDDEQATPIQSRVQRKRQILPRSVKKTKTPRKRRISMLPILRKSTRLSISQSLLK